MLLKFINKPLLENNLINNLQFIKNKVEQVLLIQKSINNYKTELYNKL